MDGEGARRAPAAAYYECTFCKRGFTNAQALGGHMNIHRKDRGAGGKSQGGGGGQQHEGSGGGGGGGAGQQHGRDVHLGLTLGRNEDGVDLELRLGHGHYPYN
ncbi:zinc finger protein STAMENLESS 1-like [Oryza brachyantha]|uniref:zinc finger protein STAMENLESS 1-like n=1 Tax=Oryza brachyantha TaxID=4533 RepID=UPI001ADD491F|nr:zinc finger protein STAMENLESS 1-like [Oryza brachyantha]